MKHIAALISGGVDSASALARYIALYPDNAPHITAYYLKIWLEDELAFLGECPWEEDLYYAEKVCEQLQIPLKVISLQREYYELIVSYTIDELKAGRTPSPDIFCNQQIKFGVFLDKIQEADFIISGHYARVEHNPTRLLRSPDRIKDQTYFLSRLSFEQISKLILPLGDMTKPQVRAFAEIHALAPHKRKDSQGICFLGKIKYNDFVKYHLGFKIGNIINERDGTILGTHKGTWFHTIGQRSGLGLGGGPWYVSKKSLEDNTVFVQHSDERQSSLISAIPITQLHIINRSFFTQQTDDSGVMHFDDIYVKIRHGEKLTSAKCTYNSNNDSGMVYLSEGDRGVAEGQFTVLYKDEECIGSAKIQ